MPTIAITGSPGITRMMKNTKVTSRSMVGINTKTLAITNAFSEANPPSLIVNLKNKNKKYLS